MADDDAEVEALTLGATTTEVVLVRHAERLDEVPDAAVQNDRPWWDPPITTKGIQQSRAAGERLRELHAQRAFEYVMVSPCARTIQTASHIAAALRLPLVLVPGLSECAAAIHKYGLAAFAPDAASSGSAGSSNATRRGRPSKEGFLTPAEALRYCAAGVEFRDAPQRYDEDFETCISRLARAAPGERLLVVTHREGIRDLVAMCGVSTRYKLPYCALSKFEFSEGGVRGGGHWQLVAPPS